MERIRRFFKKFGKGLKAKGYTLMEVACVVAVTASLSAVALPIVKSNVMDAKTVAATDNMNNLAGAIQKYYGDLGLWPDKDAVTTGAVVLRTSDLEDPVLSSGRVAGGAVTVVRNADGTYANTTTAITTTGTWTTASTVALSNVLTQNLGLRASWKGPYSSKPEITDPWGHPYYVAIADTMDIAGFVNDPNHSTAIYVLSAGPNEVIETTLKQDMQTFKKAGDDIVLRIR